MLKPYILLLLVFFSWSVDAQTPIIEAPVTPEMERLASLEKKSVLDYLFALPSGFLNIHEYIDELGLDEKDSPEIRERLLKVKNIPKGYLEYNKPHKVFYTMRNQIVLFKDRAKSRDIIAITKWDCRHSENCSIYYDFLEFDSNKCQWKDIKEEVFPELKLLEKTISESTLKRSRKEFAGFIEGVLLELPEEGTTVIAALRDSYKDLECSETDEENNRICQEPYIELRWKNGRFHLP